MKAFTKRPNYYFTLDAQVKKDFILWGALFIVIVSIILIIPWFILLSKPRQLFEVVGSFFTNSLDTMLLYQNFWICLEGTPRVAKWSIIGGIVIAQQMLIIATNYLFTPTTVYYLFQGLFVMLIKQITIPLALWKWRYDKENRGK
jgi:hypothetical protein